MSASRAQLFTPVLIAGSLVILVSFAIRGSFGVFQIPIESEFGWPRAEFSLAIAIQNLAWGIGQPIFGAISERFGDRKAIFLGALFYATGLVLSSFAMTPIAHQMLEFVVGFGIAGTGLGIILAVVGRSTSPEHRSMALGIATAAGSGGQIIGAPLAEWLLSIMGWQSVFLIFAAAILAAMAVLPFLKTTSQVSKAELEETFRSILKKAATDPTYLLIFIGFFSCGYQLGFLTAHFPAFVEELCGPIDPGGMLAGLGITTTSALGAVALSIVGAANIGGTILAGYLGNHFPKKYLLAGIYLARTIVGAVFILMPITPTSVVVFSALMGSLWLATVPLTSGLVAYIYGLRYMATLYGIVFFSHQLGSFIGIWLGGALYDIYGDYTFVWWIGVGVGLLSAIVHLPVIEKPYNARTAT